MEKSDVIIKENDSIIRLISGNYVLFIKIKDKFKLEGYFTSVESCLKRLSKRIPKYKPFYTEFKESSLLLEKISRKIYLPIKKLDQEVNGIRKF